MSTSVRGTPYVRHRVLTELHCQVSDDELHKLIIAAYNIGAGPINFACERLGSSNPITWAAVIAGRESSPLWLGIDHFKKSVCGYKEATGTYSFTLEAKYKENTNYVQEIFGRIAQ